MNLQQFRYALEIYHCQSMNKAAKILFVSQPALSQSIKDLERDLGFTIFERSTKGVSPTSQGYTFLNSISDFVQTVEQLQNAGNDDEQQVILRVSSSRYTFVTSALLRIYESTVKNRDAYTISLHEVDCAHVMKDVYSGRSDIGILHFMESTHDLGLHELDRKGLAYHLLAKSHSHVTFRKDHPLAKLDKVCIADIAKYPQIRITTENTDPYDEYTGFNYVKYGNSYKNIMADNRSQIYALVARTDAVSYGVTHLEIDEYYPNMLTRRVADDEAHYYIYEVHQKNRPLTDCMNKFIHCLQEIGQEEMETGE